MYMLFFLQQKNSVFPELQTNIVYKIFPKMQAPTLMLGKLRGLPYMTSAKFSDFLIPSPLVHIFTQPPLLNSLTSSALPGLPSPLECGHHIWKPPKDGRQCVGVIEKVYGVRGGVLTLKPCTFCCSSKMSLK